MVKKPNYFITSCEKAFMSMAICRLLVAARITKRGIYYFLSVAPTLFIIGNIWTDEWNVIRGLWRIQSWLHLSGL